MAERPIRIFFPVFADADNFNAQSLNGREIARRLDAKRFACTFFYSRQPDPRIAGLPHMRLLKLPARLGTVRMILESFSGYDIMFSPGMGRFSRIYYGMPKLFRRKTVSLYWVESHMTDHLKACGTKEKKRFAGMLRHMDEYFAITEYVAQTTSRDFGIDVSRVMSVGVDTKIFTPPVFRGTGRPRVLFVGHLIERKGPRYVLKAAAEFRNADFVLVGERRGDFHKGLWETVEREKLDNVKFLPPVPQEELAGLMKESDILLHPSLTESVGKVILEGAATGLPAVIFSHYGSPAVVSETTGFQVDTFEDMLQRLGVLIEDRPLRQGMGSAAIEYARTFDWDSIVPAWEEAFEKIARKMERS